MIYDINAAREAQAARSGKLRTRYIIIIGNDEEPARAAQELQEGTLTVMITARNTEEAIRLYKQSEALLRSHDV